MTNCKEFVLDDMTAITAIPVSDMPPRDSTSPVNRLTPTIPSAGFTPVLTHAVVIGVATAGSSGASLIPIRRNSGKAKDDESDSVAGRLHTVTVNCEVDERGGEIWSHQLALERSAHHLLLTFRDGTQGFVSCTEDTYQCTVERDGAKVSAAFKIQNLMGIQMLV